MHHAMQLLDPDCCICFDEDEPQARATRGRILTRIAEDNALMLPAHFPTTGALEITRRGAHFAVKQWMLPNPLDGVLLHLGRTVDGQLTRAMQVERWDVQGEGVVLSGWAHLGELDRVKRGD